ncbi:MAG: hypothetical protein PVH18_01020 [Chloroflexota bacterium]|jgi:hypothetical protein
MGFLRRFFGGDDSSRSSEADDQGFFLYVQCDNCGAKVRLRVHKQHDLNYEDGGYVWVKTIVDSKCFRPMRTVAHFDSNYRMTSSELEGGHYISREQYEAPEAVPDAEPDPPEEQSQTG